MGIRFLWSLPIFQQSSYAVVSNYFINNEIQNINLVELNEANIFLLLNKLIHFVSKLNYSFETFKNMSLDKDIWNN